MDHAFISHDAAPPVISPSGSVKVLALPDQHTRQAAKAESNVAITTSENVNQSLKGSPEPFAFVVAEGDPSTDKILSDKPAYPNWIQHIIENFGEPDAADGLLELS